MELKLILPLVEKINGCTFATIDAISEPKPGVSHRISGQRVIIFRTAGGSGYENMIKKRLEEAGKDPESFNVGPLPWGTRLGNLPIIEHKGELYLQTIELSPGKEEYFLTFAGTPVNPKDFGIRPSRGFTGVSPESTVKMHTYKLSSITRITLMGETLGETQTADKPSRSILRIKH